MFLAIHAHKRRFQIAAPIPTITSEANHGTAIHYGKLRVTMEASWDKAKRGSPATPTQIIVLALFCAAGVVTCSATTLASTLLPSSPMPTSCSGGDSKLRSAREFRNGSVSPIEALPRSGHSQARRGPLP